MTHRTSLSSAAFWHGQVCLGCGAGLDEEERPEDKACPECGEEALVDARGLAGWLAQVDREEEGG